MGDIIEYLNRLIKSNEKVVVGISGGPDSMLLLNMLYNSIIDNNNIVVAHINHNVRKESDDEEKFVKSICDKYGVVFHSIKLPKRKSNNFERWARERRYEFYEELINKYNASYLMTAHHGDDLVETILMKIVRGSNLKGYSGFSKEEEREDYQLIRPLIGKTKDDIVLYNNDHGIEYVVDSSNTSLMYTRNRYRHNILSKFKEEDPNVHFKFLKFSENIKDISNFFDKYVCEQEKFVIDNDCIIISKLCNYDLIVQKQIIYNYLFKYYQNDIILVNSNHINSIIDMINNVRPNISINLPGCLVIKEYDRLFISKTIDSISLDKIEIVDKVIWNDREIIKVCNSNLSSNYVIYLNSKDIKLPLFVRNRKSGDKIKIKNMSHYKKVKDIFINEKISMIDRNKYPIVVDSNDEIIWIPGLKKSHFDSQKSGKYDIILEYH